MGGNQALDPFSLYGLGNNSLLYGNLGSYNNLGLSSYYPGYCDVASWYGYGLPSTTSTTSSIPAATTTTKSSNVSFQGSTNKEPEEKNHAAGWTIGTIGILATGAALYIGSKGHVKTKDAGLLKKAGERLSTGWKELTSKVTKKAESTAAGTASEAATSAASEAVSTAPKNFRLHFGTNAADSYVEIPGRSRVLKPQKGYNRKAFEAECRSLGIDPKEVVKLGDHNTKALSYILEHDGNTFAIRGNEIVGYTKGSENLMHTLKDLEGPNYDYLQNIRKTIANINAGKTIGNEYAVSNLRYMQEVDGVKKYFSMAKGNPTLEGVRTNRHKLDSEAAKAYGINHSEYGAIMDQAINGKPITGNLTEYRYKIDSSGNYILVKNGEVQMVQTGGKKYIPGKDDYVIWANDAKNKDMLTKALNREDKSLITNAIYE